MAGAAIRARAVKQGVRRDERRPAHMFPFPEQSGARPLVRQHNRRVPARLYAAFWLPSPEPRGLHSRAGSRRSATPEGVMQMPQEINSVADSCPTRLAAGFAEA